MPCPNRGRRRLVRITTNLTAHLQSWRVYPERWDLTRIKSNIVLIKRRSDLYSVRRRTAAFNSGMNMALAPRAEHTPFHLFPEDPRLKGNRYAHSVIAFADTRRKKLPG